MTEGSDCPTGKEQFGTREAARERVDAMARRGRKLRIYRCPMCGCLHVAHKKRSQKKREHLGR